jgi:hypothetical protein
VRVSVRTRLLAVLAASAATVFVGLPHAAAFVAVSETPQGAYWNPVELTIPSSMVTIAADDSGAAVSYTVSAFSWRGTPHAISCSYPEGTWGYGFLMATARFPIGTTTVSCTAGRVTDSFDVTVNPPAASSAPVVTVPVDQTVEAGGPLGAMIDYPQATAVDGWGNPLPVSCSPQSDTVFPLGTTQVRCTATDGAGTLGIAFFSVRVQDTTPPLLYVPTALTIDADSSARTAATNPAIAAFLAAAGASDLVDRSPTVTDDAPATFAIGTTTVTFTATDESGNRATAASALTLTDPGLVAWRGDYETGSFSQWGEHQWSRNNDQGYTCADVGDSEADIVTSAVTSGRNAAKFVVYPSSCATAQRSEVAVSEAKTGGFGGQDWWYGWWTMFPAAGNLNSFWQPGGDWNVFTDFHNPGACESNVEFGIDNTSWTPQIYYDDTTFATGSCHTAASHNKTEFPLAYDHWYHFVLHVKWSSNPSIGFTELYVDGTPRSPQRYGQTLTDDTQGAYWKQGFYRTTFAGTNTVYHDGACRATTYTAAAAC